MSVMLKRFAVVLGLAGGVIGCDGVGGATWESAVDRAAQGICGWDEMCNGNMDGKSLGACLSDVKVDLEDARTQLISEANCIHCLNVTADETERSVFASCQPPPDAAKIAAACGANKEICAGKP